MPPKKKKAGKGKKAKKGKGKKKDGDGAELTADDLYKRTTQEVHSLKEQLAERREYARRSRASEELMRDRMAESRTMVESERSSKKELSYDLTRQYKTMQAQLESRIEFLESHVKRLQTNLDETRLNLLKVTQERDQIRREREEQVAALNSQLHVMERSYETILQDVFEALAGRLEAARCKWEAESRQVEQSTQQVLLEFGRGLTLKQCT